MYKVTLKWVPSVSTDVVSQKLTIVHVSGTGEVLVDESLGADVNTYTFDAVEGQEYQVSLTAVDWVNNVSEPTQALIKIANVPPQPPTDLIFEIV